jgi:hypothetical protein
MKPPAARARFRRPPVPTIACINKATVDLGVDFNRLIVALQTFVDRHFAPVWGTQAKLVRSREFIDGAWAMVFLDDPDAAGLEGYHELTRHRLPLSKVFVKTTLKDGEKVSVTASHELAEMLVDPAGNLWAEGPHGRLYGYEMADAVEEAHFKIDGILMSDFVYPAFFEVFRKPHSARFDHCRKVTRPLQLLKGGYHLVRKGGVVKEVFGSLSKARRFALEDRRQHRSTYRRRGRPPMTPSTAR